MYTISFIYAVISNYKKSSQGEQNERAISW